MSPPPLERARARLLASVCGRGFPAWWQGGSPHESEVLSHALALRREWGGAVSPKEARDLCAGTWRAVFTTSEALRSVSSMPGGPLGEYFESVGDDVVHTAAPTRVMMFCILMVLAFPALVAVAGYFRVGVVGGAVLVWVVAKIVEAVSFTGVFASRRKAFNVDADLMATSTLERDVICIWANRLGYDRNLANPMLDFCRKFDASDGAKDPLKPSLLLGWRFIPKYPAIHVLSASKGLERRERILYVDDELRVMLGGDVSGLDGSVTQCLTVFVRV